MFVKYDENIFLKITLVIQLNKQIRVQPGENETQTAAASSQSLTGVKSKSSDSKSGGVIGAYTNSSLTVGTFNYG